jgi:hypothetical protein
MRDSALHQMALTRVGVGSSALHQMANAQRPGGREQHARKAAVAKAQCCSKVPSTRHAQRPRRRALCLVTAFCSCDHSPRSPAVPLASC